MNRDGTHAWWIFYILRNVDFLVNDDTFYVQMKTSGKLLSPKKCQKDDVFAPRFIFWGRQTVEQPSLLRLQAPPVTNIRVCELSG